MSSGVFDTKKHSNVQRKPEYRRIKKNYKSLRKFKEEKTRRQQVLMLQHKRLTIKEIAERLGVSERTVKRDLAKLMTFNKKKLTQLSREVDSELLNEFNSLSLKDQIKRVRAYDEFRSSICKVRPCSSLVVTIDVDDVFSGKCGVSFTPHLPVDMVEDGKITFELAACGRKEAVARIYVGKVVGKVNRGCANLQTNLSMNAFVKPNLRGLRVVGLEAGDDFSK